MHAKTLSEAAVGTIEGSSATEYHLADSAAAVVSSSMTPEQCAALLELQLLPGTGQDRGSKQRKFKAALRKLSVDDTLALLLRDNSKMLDELSGNVKAILGKEDNLLEVVSILDSAGITGKDLNHRIFKDWQRTSKEFAGTCIGLAVDRLLQKPDRY